MSERDEWDDDYPEHYDDDLDDDEREVMLCGTQGCLLSGWQYHTSEECYTQAHVEAYERYHNPRWWTRAYDWLLGIGLAVSLMPGRVMRRIRGKRCAHCGRNKCDDCQSCDLPF